MQSARNPTIETAALASVLIAGVALAGCGMPGAPQPPSLNLPARVTSLSAVRTGDQVALAWKMPRRNTDKTPMKGNATVRVCRNQSAASPCSTVTTLQVAPDAEGAFTDTLPPQLAAGSPRPLTYFVELDNRKGRSAGLSNGAEILAGQAPPAVSGLSAELRRDGVLLTWAPLPPAQESFAIRLQRKLLTPPAQKPAQGPLSQPAEPLEQTLLVEAGPHADRALDTHIRFGETYEFIAQRVERVTTDGQTLELASAPSLPVRIDTLNVFPPEVPKGLAAVATPGENGNPPAIDLNWLPVTSPDLAGYIVYRRDVSAENHGSAWQRISPMKPIVGPGYHDAEVQPGHAYAYAVSAIGQNGHESARSAEAQETVPSP